MMHSRSSGILRYKIPITHLWLFQLAILIALQGQLAAQPSPDAVKSYNAYISQVETDLNKQHHASATFLAPFSAGQQGEAHLHHGEFIIEAVSSAEKSELKGALLHHWRGTTFAPGAKLDDVERLLKNFNSYPQLYAPQVLSAKILDQNGDHLHATMRVRQKHILTVVLDSTYDITYGRLDAQHGYSSSESTQISEVADSGTTKEHILSAQEAHGFLWRQNTYWSYEERDGGVYMQIESVSMSRSIPTGLGWAIRPFVESVPRESLEFTLRSTCNALKK
jgi:hypothetical protein